MLELIILSATAGWLAFSVTYSIHKAKKRIDSLEGIIEEHSTKDKTDNLDAAVEVKKQHLVTDKLSRQIETLILDKNELQNKILGIQNELDAFKFEVKRTNQSNQ